jgi:hypothetical protein
MAARLLSASVARSLSAGATSQSAKLTAAGRVSDGLSAKTALGGSTRGGGRATATLAGAASPSAKIAAGAQSAPRLGGLAALAADILSAAQANAGFPTRIKLVARVIGAGVARAGIAGVTAVSAKTRGAASLAVGALTRVRLFGAVFGAATYQPAPRGSAKMSLTLISTATGKPITNAQANMMMKLAAGASARGRPINAIFLMFRMMGAAVIRAASSLISPIIGIATATDSAVYMVHTQETPSEPPIEGSEF